MTEPKKLWNTILIRIPKDMINITKSGRVKIKAPLTKTGNIAKSNGEASIKIKIADINDPEIINKGKEWTLTDLKKALKNTKIISHKQKQKKTDQLAKKFIDKIKKKKREKQIADINTIYKANSDFLDVVDSILNVKSGFTYQKNKEKYQESIENAIIIKSVSQKEKTILIMIQL